MLIFSYSWSQPCDPEDGLEYSKYHSLLLSSDVLLHGFHLLQVFSNAPVGVTVDNKILKAGRLHYSVLFSQFKSGDSQKRN